MFGCKEYVKSKQYEANEVLDSITEAINDYNEMYRKE